MKKISKTITILIGLISTAGLAACNSGGGNVTESLNTAKSLNNETFTIDGEKFKDIKSLKAYLANDIFEPGYEGQKKQILDFPEWSLEEMIMKINGKRAQVTSSELIVRIIAITSMSTIAIKGKYDLKNEFYFIPKPWGTFDDVFDPDKNGAKVPSPDGVHAMAFKINNNEINDWPKKLNQLKEKSMTLDCSMAKQLALLSGIIASGDTSPSPYVIFNESFVLKDSLKIDTVYKHWEKKRIAKTAIMDIEKELVPGDSVYFQNDPNYKVSIDAISSGEHAIYAGEDKFVAFDYPEMTRSATIISDLKSAFTKQTKKEPANGYPKLVNEVEQFQP
jgi:hypothetical protein